VTRPCRPVIDQERNMTKVFYGGAKLDCIPRIGDQVPMSSYRQQRSRSENLDAAGVTTTYAGLRNSLLIISFPQIKTLPEMQFTGRTAPPVYFTRAAEAILKRDLPPLVRKGRLEQYRYCRYCMPGGYGSQVFLFLMVSEGWCSVDRFSLSLTFHPQWCHLSESALHCERGKNQRE